MRNPGLAAISAGVVLYLGGYGLATNAAPRPEAVPTFSKDVAPILYKNCAGCHRPGEIGPMSLLTYENARPHAADIRDEVRAGSMPPWDADPKYGKFLNDRRLSDAEKDVITRWVDGGAPRGDDKDLPPQPAYVSGWSIGAPDVVLSMPTEFEVPAKGTIEYQYFEVPTNFTEDKWIQAMEIRPGARRVVHHVLVYCREPAGSPARPRALIPILTAPGAQGTPGSAAPVAPPAVAAAGAAGSVGAAGAAGTPARQGAAAAIAGAPPRQLGTLIATTAPGTNAMVFRPGSALQIRAGSVLTFQVHYTATGEATRDRSSIGMVFSKTPPVDEVRASQFINTRFNIPAGAADYKVDAGTGFSEDVHVWGLFPHTHLRGKRWEYQLVYPDGRTETILAVPAYDFNWQTYYMFTEPLAVPKGSKILSSAWYDNSVGNRSNPDPKSDVHWGDQTWEEMQYTGISYTVDSQHKTGKAGGSY